LSPTVFRDGEFRFFFFSREESHIHVHVSHPDDEAKFWLKPTIELARNIGLSSAKVKDAEPLVESRQQEFEGYVIRGRESSFSPAIHNHLGLSSERINKQIPRHQAAAKTASKLHDRGAD
jgi:hypothetical protein